MAGADVPGRDGRHHRLRDRRGGNPSRADVPNAGRALFAVGAIALFGFNDQDARVLLIIPYALAAVAAAGTIPWRSSRAVAPSRRRVTTAD